MYLSKRKQKLKQNDILYLEEEAQGIQFILLFLPFSFFFF